MPRKKAIDYPGVEEKLRETFDATQSVKETAEAAGLSTKTTRKYLREFNYNLKPGRKPGIRYSNAKRSPVVSYLRSHKDPLPRSVSGAARKMGVTKDTLTSYLRRRREKYRDFLSNNGPLNNLDFLITDDRGRKLPLRALAEYRIADVLPNGKAKIEGRLPTGNSVRATFRVADLATYLKDTRPDSPERKEDG